MEALIHSLAEPDFAEVVLHLPRMHQDAYRLARYLRLEVRQVARLRGGDLLETGVRVNGRVMPWPLDGMAQVALRERLLALRQQLAEGERIVDSHKPYCKAASDLEQGFAWGITLWKQAQQWRDRPIEARLPNFVLLGVPKSATTWLHDCLAVHPDIYVPERKELEFFGNHLYQQGLNWYKSFFASAATRKAVGDTSIGYLSSADAPEQIRQHLDGERLKLIVLLREPVSRAVSWYKYRLLSRNAPLRFEEFIARYPTRVTCVESGHYVRDFQRYLRWFRKEQFLVLLYEDIARDPRGAIRKVFDFLEVDPDFTSTMFARKRNPGQGIRHLRLHYGVLQAGIALQRAIPYGGLGYRCRQCLEWINRKYNVSAGPGESFISPESLERLYDEFAPSNRMLASLWGLDLSSWDEAQRQKRAA